MFVQPEVSLSVLEVRSIDSKVRVVVVPTASRFFPAVLASTS